MLLAIAAGLFVWAPGESLWISPCLRVGMLMSLVWLAHPHLKDLPWWLMAGGGLIVMALVVFKNPRTLAMLVVVGVILARFRPRRRSATAK